MEIPRSKKRGTAPAGTKSSLRRPETANRSRRIRPLSLSKGLRPRARAILGAAVAAGFLGGEKTERIGGRVTHELLSAAKTRSGLSSQTELLEYALAMVALEDGYGATLLSMKGSIPDDVEI
jgi:hypothetical protein